MKQYQFAFIGRILAQVTLILVAFLSAQSAVAQSSCLEVRVLDPTSAQLPTAVVAVGSKEVPVDDSGVASLCDLGQGPHSLVVIAPGFEPQEVTAQESTGQITVVLSDRDCSARAGRGGNSCGSPHGDRIARAG